MRETGKTYHMSDVAGGTDLQVMQVEPSQVSSTRNVTRVISFTRLLRATFLGGAWVRGYLKHRYQDKFLGKIILQHTVFKVSYQMQY